MENKWENATTDIISHLPHTNFSHYSLQLNTYKYIIENSYKKKVSNMYLVCMHPNYDNYLLITLKTITIYINIFL